MALVFCSQRRFLAESRSKGREQGEGGKSLCNRAKSLKGDQRTLLFIRIRFDTWIMDDGQFCSLLGAVL